MGGTCQVQWEFQVKWVIFSPAVYVCMCVRKGVGAGFVMSVCDGFEHLGVFLKYPGG